jgi:hypothetical protein
MGRGRAWAEDDKRLRKLAPTCTSAEIARRLDRTANAVQLRARRLEIRLRDSTDRYTPIELDALRALAPRYTGAEIASLIRRPAHALRGVAKRLGIALAKRSNEWTSGHTKILRANAATKTPKELAKLIGHSAHLVRITARKLGIRLKKRRPQQPWLDSDLKVLRNLAGTMPAADIAKRINRSKGTVVQAALRRGISLRVEPRRRNRRSSTRR